LTDRPATPLLDQVNLPSDLKRFSDSELEQVASELRAETISAVSETGGHLGAGLGVVELTVALHAVLRTEGGLSGFTKRSESPYDPFGAAHSSTSISAALGMAVARDLGGAPEHGLGDAIAVIVIVILNDNEMSIAPPVGALSSYLSRLYAGAPFQEFKAAAKGAVSLLPEPFQEGARRAKEMVKGMTVGGTMFEELGFSYVGPIDGHDMEQLLQVLRTVKARADGPILIHAITRKGKGYAPAETAMDKGHATAKFDVVSGKQKKSPSNAPSYTKVFAQALIQEAEADDKIETVLRDLFDLPSTGL